MRQAALGLPFVVCPAPHLYLTWTSGLQPLEADENLDMRQAALGLLVELARTRSSWSVICALPGLAAATQRLLVRHASLSPEDKEAEVRGA